MLEVIDKGEVTQQHPAPLLFVHGAWQAGWCWDINFIDFFAEQGFRAVALSMRGHGASTPAKPSRIWSISDYLSDVASVADKLPAAPVMVGHSMGGFLVQKYLEDRELPAAVLLGSAPPRGQLRSLLRPMARHPWRCTKFSLTGKPAHLYGSSPAGARELFFGDKADDDLANAFAARLQSDSDRAIFFDMVAGNLVRTNRVSTPVLVIGGEKDRIYNQSDVRRTANAYHTEPVFMPGMGHELMIEPGWAAVAERIKCWLGQQGL
jgi:pimeloyl-ACP methyl ester carboxylesterase